MQESLTELMAVELKRIRFRVHCGCGKDFIAEYFEPECPYCDRRYFIKMLGNKKEVKISIFE
ncbi:MAG: hypothetical protein H3Z52_06095 [archaeon]|nr:hypothetical protein [archaeon]